MYCPKCGNKVDNGDRFCTLCGHELKGIPLEDVQKDETVQAKNSSEMPDQCSESIDPVRESVIEAEEAAKTEENVNAEETADTEDSAAVPEKKNPSGYDEYYTEKPKKKSRLPLIIILCAVAAAVIAIIFAVRANKGPAPDQRITEAAEQTFSDLASRSELTSFFYGLSDAESFGVNMKAESLGELIGSVAGSFVQDDLGILQILGLLDIGGECEVVSDQKGNSSAYIGLQLFGNPLKAGIYKTSEKEMDAAMSFPLLFKKDYGASLTDESALDSSIFAPGSGSKYELSEDVFKMLKNAVESFSSSGNIQKLKPEDVQEKLKNNGASGFVYKKSKEEADVGDAVVKCETYTASISKEQAIAICETFKEIYQLAAVLSDNVDYSAFSYILGESAEGSELFDKIVDLLSGAEFSAELKYYIYNDHLVRASVDGNLNDKTLSASVAFGTDPKTSKEVTADVHIGEKDFRVVLDLSEAQENCFTLKLLSDNAGINENLDFHYEKKDSAFKLTFSALDGFELGGTLKISETEVLIEEPYIAFSKDMTPITLSKVTLAFTKGEKVRTLSEDFADGYEDILKMNEKEFSEVVEPFENIQNLLMLLMLQQG